MVVLIASSPFAVFDLGEDVEDENPFGSEIQTRDQSVFVSVNIKDGPSTNNIGVSEITLHIG
jgi:hypothetical protein